MATCQGKHKMLFSFPTLLLSLWANIRQHVMWLGKQTSHFCSRQTKPYRIKPLPIFPLSFCLLKKASYVSLRAAMLQGRNFHHSSGFFSSETGWSGLPPPGLSQPWRRGCLMNVWGLCGVLWDWQTKLINPVVVYKSHAAQQERTKLVTLLDWCIWQTSRAVNTKPIWSFYLLLLYSVDSNNLIRQIFSLTTAERKNRNQAGYGRKPKEFVKKQLIWKMKAFPALFFS